jgi:glutamine synthetase
MSPITNAELAELRSRIDSLGLERLRFAWCDLQGTLRSKTLTRHAALSALTTGVGMAGTLVLKDHADKTAFPVFDARALRAMADLQGPHGLPRFEQASNVFLRAVPQTLRVLPWDHTTGLIQCEATFADGEAMPWDTRLILRQALARLAARGLRFRCGLEVEFHVYTIKNSAPQLDPLLAAWPGSAPELEMLHPGYRLMADDYATLCEEPLAIIERTALELGLPLSSLEIEFGPSQLEAVFSVSDGLEAADQMVLFRNLVRQALRRAGYFMSFVCRPPFPQVMSSGWHLHQSLMDSSGRNAFALAPNPAAAAPRSDAAAYLTNEGCQYLAGLLEHTQAMSALCVPTIVGYDRFIPHALAPQVAVWGHDSRSALLRVIGGPGDDATRLENRLGEPMANPYLYLASQIHAGLDGIDRALVPPPAAAACDALADRSDLRLPRNLAQATEALAGSVLFKKSLGADFVAYFAHIQRSQWARFQAAADPSDFLSREYFSRF